MKDSIEQLLNALEHPENYSDAEVEQLLTDPEAREVYEMLRKTAGASAPVPEINIDEEWQRFETKQTKRRRATLRCIPFVASRNTAAVVIALVGTLAVVAATIGVTHYFNTNKGISHTEQSEPQKQTAIVNSNVASTDTIPDETTPPSKTILFKGDDFETILADIAKYYGVSVRFNQDSTKSLQLYFEWNQALPLGEIVDQLNNFEQISITLSNKVLTVK